MTVLMLTISGFRLPVQSRGPRSGCSRTSGSASSDWRRFPPASGPPTPCTRTWSTRAAMRWRSSGREYTSYGTSHKLVIMHDPTFGTPIGGGGGTGGRRRGRNGRRRRHGRRAQSLPRMHVHHRPGLRPRHGTRPDAATSSTSRPMPRRRRTRARSSPWTPAAGAVASLVPVGNDPQGLALSDDGSALWVASPASDGCGG